VVKLNDARVDRAQKPRADLILVILIDRHVICKVLVATGSDRSRGHKNVFLEESLQLCSMERTDSLPAVYNLCLLQF
jgi:hypothetical protein